MSTRDSCVMWVVSLVVLQLQLTACDDAAKPVAVTRSAQANQSATDEPASTLPSELATRFCRGTSGRIPGWWEQLVLSENGGYSLQYSGRGGCVVGVDGDTAGTSVGHARLAGGVLNLIPDGAAESQVPTGSGLLDPLIIIEWSGRIYLVPEAAMLTWCNEVNLGAEPRRTLAGSSFLNYTEFIPRGKPKVPAQWEKYLLAHTIEGKTVEAAGSTGAIVDIGQETGLLTGMVLVLRLVPVDADAVAQGAPPFRDYNLVVTEVGDQRSTVAWGYGGVTRPIPIGYGVTSRATCDN